MRKLLEDSRKRVGVETTDLKAVVAAALGRAGASLDAARAGEVGGAELFRLDPATPVFGHGGWQEALDDLRIRRRGRRERLKAWRAEAPLKTIAFEPARDPETGVDAPDVVQVHLEHRLVRRLLSRFLSQGFTSGLSRVCSIIGPGAQPRVVLIGRLALYGPGAARLHEELLMVTAAWTEPDRRTSPLRPFGGRGEEATLDQLERALRENRTPHSAIVERLRSSATRDAGDLDAELRRRAEARAIAPRYTWRGRERPSEDSCLTERTCPTCPGRQPHMCTKFSKGPNRPTCLSSSRPNSSWSSI
jgi:hypothetical protein